MRKRGKTVRCCRILLILCVCISLLSGCQKRQETEQMEVEYTIMTDKELPEELLTIIEENKTQEMRLTWMDQEEMYLIRGYGEQLTGGYSVAVAGCTEDETTLWFTTRLIGPDEGEASGAASYPYLAVKIDATEKEVVIE
ncbi:MAG: protease complex subunit PrcB family protein [Clostridiales bacterium]|nr:protease complex subunit PrcB family protein [Clostridiales bacterium]